MNTIFTKLLAEVLEIRQREQGILKAIQVFEHNRASAERGGHITPDQSDLLLCSLAETPRSTKTPKTKEARKRK